MSFGVQQKKRNRTWGQILVEESDYSLRARGAKRERTFRRMYLTVFVFFPALLLVYTSLFYAGAFVDPGKVIGISHAQRAATAKSNVGKLRIEKQYPVISPLFNAFSVNKVYLRQGQSIQLSYALPNGTELRAKIKQCKSFPILEVFKCQFVSEQEKRIRNGSQGVLEFTAASAGFYYFDDEVIKRPSITLKPNHDYTIVWQRT